jgi:hypothetical protein
MTTRPVIQVILALMLAVCPPIWCRCSLAVSLLDGPAADARGDIAQPPRHCCGSSECEAGAAADVPGSQPGPASPCDCFCCDWHDSLAVARADLPVWLIHQLIPDCLGGPAAALLCGGGPAQDHIPSRRWIQGACRDAPVSDYAPSLVDQGCLLRV